MRCWPQGPIHAGSTGISRRRNRRRRALHTALRVSDTAFAELFDKEEAEKS
jgi:hypothetical protein